MVSRYQGPSHHTTGTCGRTDDNVGYHHEGNVRSILLGIERVSAILSESSAN